MCSVDIRQCAREISVTRSRVKLANVLLEGRKHITVESLIVAQLMCIDWWRTETVDCYWVTDFISFGCLMKFYAHWALTYIMSCWLVLSSMCVTGTFGRVYFGTLLTNDSDNTVDRPVFIKTVTGKSCCFLATQLLLKVYLWNVSLYVCAYDLFITTFFTYCFNCQ